MKKTLFIFLITCALFARSQEKFIISGLVKDKTTGEPLIGANISVGNLGKGTSTNEHGFYSIEIQNITQTNITVSYIGYKHYKTNAKVGPIMRLDIFLEPGVEMDEINITANKSFAQKDVPGMTELSIKQIKLIPILGEHDLIKTLQLLPGVQGGSEGRNGMYVRGGSPDQNLFLLDGTPLYYVNHLGGFVSTFNTDVLKNIQFYKGGFPARFGGRLSSIIDLRLKDGDNKKFSGSYGIGLISGDITLEGPIKSEKTSFIVSARRVWADVLLRPLTKMTFQQSSMGYNFYDLYGKLSHEINPYNRIYFSFYGGDDHLGYFYNVPAEKSKSYAKYIWGNILSTVRWNRIKNPKLNSDYTLFYTRYRYKNEIYYKSEDDFGQNLYTTSVHEGGLKTDNSFYLSEKVKIRFGGGLSGNWFIPGQISSNYNNVVGISDTIIGSNNNTSALNIFAYSEADYSPVNWLNLNVGVRIADFLVENEHYFSVEPRIFSNINFGNYGILKLGFSQMTQPEHLLTYSGSSFPADIWLPSTPMIPPGTSNQFSIEYAKTLNKGKYELVVELYSKTMKNLLEVKAGVPLVHAQNWKNNVETDGTGYSRGIEFLFQKNTGSTTGWIGYTLSKAERVFQNINNDKPYPFKYDRRHDLQFVVNHSFNGTVDLSATWVYGTGYPITLNNGVYETYHPVEENIFSPESSFFIIGDAQAYLYPGKNWLKMRDYHRLDLGVNFRKQRKKASGKTSERTWTIGVFNLYNRQNAVFYYYGHENDQKSKPIKLYQQSGFPILPSIKYSVRF